MTGAESEQPVGAPFYQWVGVGRLREDQFICTCRDQRKHVFNNMGPLSVLYNELNKEIKLIFVLLEKLEFRRCASGKDVNIRVCVVYLLD